MIDFNLLNGDYAYFWRSFNSVDEAETAVTLAEKIHIVVEDSEKLSGNVIALVADNVGMY